MKKLLLTAVAAVTLLSSLSFALDAMVMQNSTLDMSDGKMVKGSTVLQNGTTVESGWYKDYVVGNITSTIKSGKTAIIFFYSSDSDTAVMLDADIKAKRQTIPNDFVIINVKVDKEAYLRKLYNVKLKGGIIVISPKGVILARKGWLTSLDQVLRTVGRKPLGMMGDDFMINYDLLNEVRATPTVENENGVKV